MNTHRVYLVVLTLLVSILAIQTKSALACELCTIPRLGRQEQLVKTEDSDKKWFFEFLFEEQNWDELDPAAAHTLHHNGHHVHDKRAEYFYHLTLGRHLSDNLLLTATIPYVIRKSFGVEHANLGVKEDSEGFGDLSLLANFKAWQSDDSVIGLVGGIKAPTGKTDAKDSTGTKFEPELQPGSGSTDIILGGVFEHQWERFIIKGNATYTFKNEGTQDFKFGNLFSTSLFMDYVLNPASEIFRTKAGLDMNYQYAQEDETAGAEEPDSGGHIIFVGPTITVDGPRNTSIFANFLYPVYQDPGGFHQELDYVWTAGGKIAF